MRPLRSLLPLLFSLFIAWPVLAQETPAPADPELVALAQELLDAIIQDAGSIDFNYNDICDPEEKEPLLALLSYGGYDLDNDGKVDFIEMAVETFFVCRPFLPFPFGRRVFILNYRKQHPGPLKAKELRLAIEEELALYASSELAGLTRWPGWQEKWRSQLVKDEDHNRNGILEHDELVMRGAYDHLLLKMFSSSFNDDFDLNGDGVLSKEERDAVINIIKEDIDLDGDGQVSLNELQILVCFSFDKWVPGNFHPAPVQVKAKYVEFTKRFLSVYDRNGDGIWQPREIAFAKTKEDNLSNLFALINPGMPFTPAARDGLIKQLLATRDLNGNGRLDDAEIPRANLWKYYPPVFGPDPVDSLIGYRLADAQPPIPPQIMERFNKPAYALQRLSRDPEIPAASLEHCRKSLLALYDSNHDGKLDAEEAFVGERLESFLRNSLSSSKKPFPFTLEQQQNWIAKIVAIYDENRDGRLSLVEAIRFHKMEALWICNQGNRQLDKNGDGWLDPDERKPLEQEIPKHYDLNKNGVLDGQEWLLMAYDIIERIQLLENPVSPDELAVWYKIRGLFDFDQAGHFDPWLISEKSMLFDFGPKEKFTCQDLLRFYDFLLKNYDHNQDGRIDLPEMQEFRKWSRAWSGLARIKNLPVMPASLPELWQFSLQNGDANGDGKLSLQELVCLNEKLRRSAENQPNKWLFELEKIDLVQAIHAQVFIVREFMRLMDDLEILYPEFARDDNGALTAEGRLALAKHLLKIGDRNANGCLDYEEFYHLWHRYGIQVEDARNKREQEKIIHEQEQQRREQEQQRQLQEVKLLKKYDFNGNGKLDPEERVRAEADAKAGIQSPAQE